MTRIAKLYAWVLANPRSAISFRDFERLVVAFGYRLRRTTGSHRHYGHRAVPFVLTIQPRGKDAKTYQVEQFIAICQRYGLSLEE
ncbi:type II toxin-antitoxin system HicA family toxin [Sphingomonas sp. PAMC 26605]|uniref:type II toxin-antitoxin system HicA family toxin n=1 Tax=Sphingomonas sp. PAMC 26605 TaxID=1112214 RepID=UPI00026CDD25|nr:type II toxin-antitoxin system HicA family toxin [Sphingomonas sp. PAMC 26605]